MSNKKNGGGEEGPRTGTSNGDKSHLSDRALFERILDKMIARKGAEVHLTPNRRPSMRYDASDDFFPLRLVPVLSAVRIASMLTEIFGRATRLNERLIYGRRVFRIRTLPDGSEVVEIHRLSP
jgi:hypothetical protein